MSIDELQERLMNWLCSDWQVDVVMEGKDIAGYAVYQQRKDEYYPDRTVVYLRQFYIERDKRNRGLGSLAFRTLANERFPPGSTVVIDALASNPDGYRFWAKVGFQPYCTTMHLKYIRDNL